MVVLDYENVKVTSSDDSDDENKTSQPPSPQKHRHHRARTRRQRQERQENPNDQTDMILRLVAEMISRLWLQIKNASRFLMVDLGGYILFDRLARFCVQHPQLSICLLAGGLVTFLPFLVFLAFGISTILMTFTGFLVLEGTLLTILSMMLFGLLGALVIVLMFFAIVGVATYFGFAHIYDLYGNVESQKSPLHKFLQKENQEASQSQKTNRENSSDQHVN